MKLDKSNIVRNLATKTKFVMHLDRAIGQHGDFRWEFKHEPKRGDTAWHPSGDCTPSLSQLYDKASGSLEPETISVGLRKTFMVGHFWHQYLQHITVKILGYAEPHHLERRGVRIWDRTDNSEPRPYFWVTGAGDVAPATLPKYGDYLVDFKTMAAAQFKQPRVPEWAADKYEAQINVYMDLFDLEKALIVTICKDSPHDMREFEYRRNQPLIDAIYNKWKLVGKCLEEKIRPPADEIYPMPFTGPVNV